MESNAISESSVKIKQIKPYEDFFKLLKKNISKNTF